MVHQIENSTLSVLITSVPAKYEGLLEGQVSKAQEAEVGTNFALWST